MKNDDCGLKRYSKTDNFEIKVRSGVHGPFVSNGIPNRTFVKNGYVGIKWYTETDNFEIKIRLGVNGQDVESGIPEWTMVQLL